MSLLTRPNGYQIALIAAAAAVVVLTVLFAQRELRPEYKVYQNTYIALEEYRSTLTGDPPPAFKKGVKQILVQNEDVGPETVNRCTSCHVTMNLPHFAPTRLSRDINGNIRVDDAGNPILEQNPLYIFDLLDEQTAEKLVYQKVAGQMVDMRTVLIAHPLMGREVRPFEFHPMEEYGCTSCHSGNGRSIQARRAHGPVFDRWYESSTHAVQSPYVEVDEENDPEFAHVYNSEPGHDLLFQTSPILVGDLMEARCLQCHLFPQDQLDRVVADADVLLNQKRIEIAAIEQGIKDDRQALASLHHLRGLIASGGIETAKEEISKGLSDPTLTPEMLDALAAQRAFLNQMSSGDEATLEIDRQIAVLQDGTIAAKQHSLLEAKRTAKRMENATNSLDHAASDPAFVNAMATDASRMLENAWRGRELYFNQACYACHRIDGLSRGQVGPDLTEIGLSYPWYVKASIVWPQGKLPSSTMPNFNLDHEEVEDLMAFLMAQTNNPRALFEVDRKITIAAWEAGHPMPWEKPIPPSNIENVDFALTVYATEGCASCHKLQGFTSNVGFALENGTPEDEIDASTWFRQLFPEQSSGQQIAQAIVTHAEQIDQKVVDGVRKDAILERIEAEYPGVLESYYTNFKVASRVSDDPAYQDRLHRVFMLFITEYGLGRDIAPRLSWSGVFRNDQWLLGHFHNPSAYTAKSIMPAMPFDDTKFYSLNNMLHELGGRNRDALHAIWEVEGFQPAVAYELLCSSCHGTQRQGDGVVSEWIYPIPKNLRNATFLRNLSKEQAILSITHGVAGTPMPPWGEAIEGEAPPVLTAPQIEQLVDWLYSSLPGGTVVEEETPKWQLTPDDVIDQLNREGDPLQPNPTAGPGTFLSASLFPVLVAATPTPIIETHQLFDVVDVDEGRPQYYIKREYYTEANLVAGEKLFQENCSHCHGTEGEGNGMRAEAMSDAKPRMLTNLPWIETRDDLRLLQSIQFGVPGTSMTPWGDQTNMLQRIQLVMYIRTLSREKADRERLNDLLYEPFDQAVIDVERCRVSSYGALQQAKTEYAEAVAKREQLYAAAQRGANPDGATAAYGRELALMQEVERLEKQDGYAVALIEEIGHERQIFELLGSRVIAAELSDSMDDLFYKMVRENTLRYIPDGGCVTINDPNGGSAKKRLLEALDLWIAQRQKVFDQLKGKIWDASIVEEERALMGEINRLTNLKTTIINQLSLSEQSQERQKALLQEYQNDRGV